MKKSLMFILISVSIIFFFSKQVYASLISVGEDVFEDATVERFDGTNVITNFYDFGNGLTIENLSGQNDMHTARSGSWGMYSYTVTAGIDDLTYLAIQGHGGENQDTYIFSFDQGVYLFGFYGAESTGFGYGGEINADFFDTSSHLIGSVDLIFTGDHAWEQFHGFQSSSAIGEIHFRNIGTSTFDNVSFQVTAVPLPSTFLLLCFSLISLIGWKRRAYH